MKNRRWYSPILTLFLSVLSALMLAYALPPRDISLLGWVAMLPLLVIARIERPIVAFLCGLVAALVCAMICSGHITLAYQYGNLLGCFGSLGMVLASVSAISSLASKRMNAVMWPFFVACAGVTGELAATAFFPATIAITQHANPAALRLSSVTGFWGVTFLLWLFPAALLVAFRRSKSSLPALVVFALVMLCAWAMPARNDGRQIAVAAVQAETGSAAAHETRKLGGKVEVVVWPEILLRASSRFPSSSARYAHAYLAADVAEPNQNGKPYNSVFFYDPSGKRVAVYRKQNLFGKEKFSITSGDLSQPVKTDDFCAGLPICYDTEFTGVVREMVSEGADIILVPNHDPYLPNSLFHYLHSAAVSFRAAENGVPVVWSEARSLSSIFDSDGGLIARAPRNAEASVVAKVHLRTGKTIFTRIGDLFAYLCVVAAGVMLLVRRKR